MIEFDNLKGEVITGKKCRSLYLNDVIFYYDICRETIDIFVNDE